ncbi:LuxE/PaaK family acyltransferase [Nonomuraea cavernae]|uniref:Acyl-protein synthetase n=1 Tax=Nonomuraea cavernae TaxID=2045107 RepID=A0A917Z6N5_9ACTN|nr:acyl-protein synthetase [Nonomuraea cavernae]MCA2188677.1 acyl-protein synthetase [Nonomuraea cavernae]GGO74316.1 acyl-protein synthetase [Nonomuraea cavernae]
MTVFTLTEAEREAFLLPRLAALTVRHRDACPPYARILAAIGSEPPYARVADLPWLPVRLFKTHELRSVPRERVFRVLTSSGTTGQAPSRIHLDREAAAAQPRMLAATLRTVLGEQRLPMLIVDSRAAVRGPALSARGAGVLGMMNLGRHYTFVLDEGGEVDSAAVRAFLARHGGGRFLIFGFTFMVWLHLRELGLDLSRGILIHSGGWKRLADQAVDAAVFRGALRRECGLTRVHDFYGMVEQIGTVFLEGPDGGGLYCPDFANVLIRDPETWEEAPPGVPGVVEVVSTLPTSYPGHVLLTEDLGVVHGIDDGVWPGKRFSVLGRLPRAEVRGCSDTAVPA